MAHRMSSKGNPYRYPAGDSLGRGGQFAPKGTTGNAGIVRNDYDDVDYNDRTEQRLEEIKQKFLVDVVEQFGDKWIYDKEKLPDEYDSYYQHMRERYPDKNTMFCVNEAQYALRADLFSYVLEDVSVDYYTPECTIFASDRDEDIIVDGKKLKRAQVPYIYAYKDDKEISKIDTFYAYHNGQLYEYFRDGWKKSNNSFQDMVTEMSKDATDMYENEIVCE